MMILFEITTSTFTFFGFVIILFLGIESSSAALTVTAATSATSVAAATNKDTDDDHYYAQTTQQPEPYQQRMVDWLREHPKGFFNPSVQWKRLSGSDSDTDTDTDTDDTNANVNTTGPYAMHALTDIPKGTELIKVPREYMLDSSDVCSVVQKLVEESYKVGNGNGNESSFVEPYVSYLFDTNNVGGTTPGLLPTSWSVKSQQILDLILDTSQEREEAVQEAAQEAVQGRLEPTHFHLRSVFDICSGNVYPNPPPHTNSDNNTSTPEQQAAHEQHIENAYLFYISRSWTNTMIPVIDMFNHRNGHHKNVEMTNADDSLLESSNKTMVAYALRDIKAGEQLVYTYNECLDTSCDYGRIKYLYTTQDLFRDYGFVELYPRRYVLGCGTKENNPLYDYPDDIFSGVFPFLLDEEGDYYIDDDSKIQNLKNRIEVFRTNFLRCLASPSSNYYGDYHSGGEDGDDSEDYDEEDYDEEGDDEEDDDEEDDGRYYSHPPPNNNNYDHHQRLVAEIDVLYDNDNDNNDSNNNSKNNRKVFKWIFETPNSLTLRWIQEQLSRLQVIESKVHDGIATLGQQQQQLLSSAHQKHNHNIQHEIDTISELYEGYIEVLTLALEHKNDPIGVTKEQFLQDVELE